MADYFPRLDRDATRKADARGHIDILYESDTCVLKRTFSKRGVLRGLHWQAPPTPQVKIFRVVDGRIADFVVDMDDPGRALHHSIIGPADGWVRIAAKFAHGFYALEDSVFEYFCDGGYNEAGEVGLNIVSQVRDILGVDTVEVSGKDAAMPILSPLAPNLEPQRP